MKRLIFLLTIMSFFAFSSCSKDEKKDIDDVKPEIDLTIAGAFPQNCDVIYFDEEFTIKFAVRDNVELGSLSLDMHNNFDHHTHSTEASSCDFDEDKEVVNAFEFIQDFSIPSGSKEYVFEHKMTIPSQNNMGPVDEGDYHLYIRLTDKTGWSALKGLSVKISKR